MPFNRRVLLPPALVAVAVLLAVLMFMLRPEPEQRVVERQPVLVDVAEAVKQDIRINVRSQGTVTPRTRTTLATEVSGQVVEVSPTFVAGGMFRRGDVLLRIDERNYVADLRRAEAAVASARSQLALERGQAEVAYQDWLKFRRDVQRTPDAEALALRKPQLEHAEAELAAAEANLTFARDQLERTVIRAPYDGMVRQIHADIGQFLGVGATLADIFALGLAEVRLPIPTNRLSYLNLPEATDQDNQRPRVTLGTQIGDEWFEWRAHITRTEGVFDEQRRVLFVVAEVEDPYGVARPRMQPLRAGTFVTAQVEGRLMRDLVVLPRQVLRAGNLIWVVDDNDRLISRRVDILRTDGDEIYVSAGLESGERVALSSLSGAVTGTPVRINRSLRSDRLQEGLHGDFEQVDTEQVDMPGAGNGGDDRNNGQDAETAAMPGGPA